MLRAPAPYPNPGSWGLLEEPSGVKAVRILKREDDEVLISIAGDFIASANRRVALSTILNADALDAAETAELDELDSRMAGKARPKRADVKRAEALGMRKIRAGQLQEILDKVPAKYFPSVAAARAA